MGWVWAWSHLWRAYGTGVLQADGYVNSSGDDSSSSDDISSSGMYVYVSWSPMMRPFLSFRISGLSRLLYPRRG